MDKIMGDLPTRVAKAVASYWATRENQARKQESSGRADQGLRSAVTGGAQMAYLLSDRVDGLKGIHQEPADDLSFNLFVRSLVAHVSAFGRGN